MLVENLPACTWLVLASDCLAAEDWCVSLHFARFI
jgi:hypothetical protein